MGKRLKAAALCCVLAACMVPALTGGSNNKTTYTPETKSPVVASPAIGQDGTLRVGVDAENPPLSGMVESDNTSKIAGLDVDVAAALADELGLKLSIVDVGNDPEGALAEGKVDIVMGIDRSTSDVAFWCSDPYLPTGVVLLSLSADAPVPTASSGATFAAQVSSRSAWSVMNEFGEESLTSTNNLVEALNALSTGTVQYVATDAVRGISAAKQPHVDVHMIALMQQPGGYCVGVADENSELKTAVADAVATLTGNGVVSVIETKWLGTTLDLSGLPLTEGATAVAAMTQDTGPAAEGTAGGDAGSNNAGDGGAGSEGEGDA